MDSSRTSGEVKNKPRYDILEATSEDVPAIVECARRAFESDALHKQMFRHGQESPEIFQWRVKKYSEHFEYPYRVFAKAVPRDDHTKLVAYAAWFRPGHWAWLKQHKAEQKAAGKVDDETYPEGVDTVLLRGIDEESRGHREDYWGDKSDYWYLGAFAVDPDYQRRGIARQLIEVGIKEADKAGLPAYLEATPAGQLFYPLYGFEPTGKQIERFDGTYVNKAMLRPARKVVQQMHGGVAK